MNRHLKKSRTHLGGVERIHFIGIGGIGMSGIAEVLLNHGYNISGSDLHPTQQTQRLKALGARIAYQHDEAYVNGVDVVVYSSAIPSQNSEVLAAKQARIPVIPRAVMLGELMRFRYGIAVSGTHGKTTTTSMISHILAESGYDPTYIIGGEINGAGKNARLGTSEYVVAEADESDASFLYLRPMHAIVTNIDRDHMETYRDNFDHLVESFLHFLHQLPFYGTAVMCKDDPNVKSIISHVNCKVITYGFDESADVVFHRANMLGKPFQFSLTLPTQETLMIDLAMPGHHNMQNAAASIALAHTLGVDGKAIEKAMETFKGVMRRFDILGEIKLTQGRAVLVDDYGHHPKEIQSNLQALHQAFPDRRIVMVFQPHRYSRTQRLFEQFAETLANIDKLFLLNIYSAGEDAIDGISSEHLCEAIRGYSKNVPVCVPNEAKCFEQLNRELQSGDVLVTQGAGNIGQIAQSWLMKWQVSPFKRVKFI